MIPAWEKSVDLHLTKLYGANTYSGGVQEGAPFMRVRVCVVDATACSWIQLGKN